MKIASRIRAHRQSARARHDLQVALEGAATPSHRQELLTIARSASRTTMR